MMRGTIHRIKTGPSLNRIITIWRDLFFSCRVNDQRGRIRRVTYWKTALAILAAFSASLALADDFKTINGKEYKNATVTRVEPDGIVLRSKLGISKLYFNELPKEVQEHFHYDPANAAQFNAALQAELNRSNDAVPKTPATTPASNAGQSNGSDSVRVGLKYYSPNQLTADARKAAHEKAFSPEEEKQALAKVPAGGTCVVQLYGVVLGYANPERLSYVIFNSAGEVIDRRNGKSNVPDKYGYWWTGFDQIDLPAFEESMRLRIYHDIQAQTIGEYVFRRNQPPERICCDQFLPPNE